METLGKFIVIEGIDGAGTTTQAGLLVQRIKETGKKAIQTFEPSDGPVGSMLRQVLKKRMFLGIEELALLFSADRIDHLETVIKPSLQEGIHVICDRYSPSTYSYQGISLTDTTHSYKDNWIRTVDGRALKPDVIIYLDLPVEVSLKRIEDRGSKDIFENEAFLTKVVSRYRQYMQIEIERGDTEIVTIDGNLDAKTISDKIWTHLNHYFI